SNLVPQARQKIGVANIEIVIGIARHAAAAAHGLFQIVAGDIQIIFVAYRNGDQNVAHFRVVLVEIAEGDADELVDTGQAEQSAIPLEDADHVIRAAVQVDGLADRINLWKQIVG